MSSPTPIADLPSDRPRRSPKRHRLDHLRRLTARDRLLLSWLAEHYLLTTTQIAQALFTSTRAATLRLATLRGIDAVTPFVDVTVAGRQHLYTLGPLGMLVEPTCYHDPDRPDARAPRTSLERTERIVGSRKLGHLLGTNQLFIDLYSYTRTDPHARLVRWWSEQHATAAYAIAGIRPDGHGVWHAGGRTVGWFLEHDNGGEPLARVLAKLKAYGRLAEFGPRYPVLLRVPSRRREAHLLDALAGVPTAMPVATGVHDEHPAGPAWTLAADPGLRRWLHELPSDHGPVNPATNPHRYTDEGDAEGD
jgi:hypothetical protein